MTMESMSFDDVHDCKFVPIEVREYMIVGRKESQSFGMLDKRGMEKWRRVDPWPRRLELLQCLFLISTVYQSIYRVYFIRIHWEWP